MNKEKTVVGRCERAQKGIFVPMFLILFALKVGQFGLAADLSWFWVTLPLWGLLGIVLLIAGVGVFLYSTAKAIEGLALAWMRHKAKRAKKAKEEEEEE